MAIIDRTGASALIPEDAAKSIIDALPTTSEIMKLANQLPNMSRKQQRLPMISTLPTAYFVDGDTGLKGTSSMSWENVYLNAEKLAVIVPIPDVVLDDSDYDIWGQIQPKIVEAMGIAFDRAVIHGTNAPDAWPDDLMTQITAASHTVDEDNAAFPDIFDALLGRGTGDESGVFALVEEDGFMINGSLAQPGMKSRLRGLRDSNGQPIFMSDMKETSRYALDGETIKFVENGTLASTVRMISGDWKQLHFAIRTDIEYTWAKEATIFNASGQPEYNLFQQDMQAIRAVLRLGWVLPNPLNLTNPTDATRFPFAALLA